MVGKHVVLIGATAMFFVLGLSIGAMGTTVESDRAEIIDCGSLLTPIDPADAFKKDVALHEANGTTVRHYANVLQYSNDCKQARASRQLPTYSALGLGAVGLLAIGVVFGTGRQFLPPT